MYLSLIIVFVFARLEDKRGLNNNGVLHLKIKIHLPNDVSMLDQFSQMGGTIEPTLGVYYGQ